MPEFAILPNCVPSSLNTMSAPPASKLISATESNVISPEFEDANVTPVCPSIDTAPAIESTVILPDEVETVTAASPTVKSSYAVDMPS